MAAAAASCKHGNEAASSITGSAFIDWATQCPVLKELSLLVGRLGERLVSTHFGSPNTCDVLPTV
jgi:hypothetical protein